MSDAETSVVIEAYRVRAVAEKGPIGKRHSSFELYDLLAKCMHLSERCRRSKADFDAMRSLVAQTPRTGKNRTYVENGSDEFTVVCRFVFSNLRSEGAERSNASRYAHTLRQAKKRGLTSKTLAKHLSENGGVNALFLTRPLEAGSVTTKTLYLTEAVTMPKGTIVKLTLRRTDDNRYDVLDGPLAKREAAE